MRSMNIIDFCPKCNGLLRLRRLNGKIELYCIYCGFSKQLDSVEKLEPKIPLSNLNYLEKIIRNERKYAKREAFKEVYEARVIDVSHGVATIETRYAMKFQAGDPIGIILRVKGEIKPEYLGTVIDSYSDTLIVLTSSNLIKEDMPITIFDYEPLISYDLQLDLIKQIKGEKDVERAIIQIFNPNAIELVLNNLEQPSLKYHKLENTRDVKDAFELDFSQIKAVEAALALNDNELLLIVGPPGTGKTRVIAKIAYELMKGGEKILISSHTNRAVDNAVEILPLEKTLRVGKPEKVLEHIKKYLLSYKARQRLGQKILEVDKKVKDYSKAIENLIKELRKSKSVHEKRKLKQIISNYKMELRELIKHRNQMIKKECEELIFEIPIIGSTLIKSQLPPLINVQFDTVIIDEASQASITLALLAMVKGKKWIVVGDHKQLLPIFRAVKDLRLRRSLSAFSGLKDKYDHRHLWLQIHYRSNPDIIGFSAKYVYEGKIKAAESCSSKILNLRIKPKYEFLSTIKPVVFVHVHGVDQVVDNSRLNEKEAEVAVEIVRELIRCGISKSEIGVISPFRAQRKLIIDKLSKIKGKELIEINTVDAFQGREKEAIIFSVTDTTKLKFPTDPHRLNVAFTRARSKLIVLGNGKAITTKAKETLLYNFIEYCYKKKSIYDWEKKSWIK